MAAKTALEYLPTRIWLMKTEPDVFSFKDLCNRPLQQEAWDGVRNYQARNFMRDHMRKGDTVLFYHSNATPPGIAGLCEIVKSAAPDPTALDPLSEYHDLRCLKSAKGEASQNPWVAVTVGKPVAFSKFVSLDELRAHSELADMLLLRKGQRLSILPVSQPELDCILKIASAK